MSRSYHSSLFIVSSFSECETSIPYGTTPQNIIVLGPDTDQNFLLTPEPNKKYPPQIFQQQLRKAAMSPNTFSTQESGKNSKQKPKQFWKRVLFAKNSEILYNYSESY